MGSVIVLDKIILSILQIVIKLAFIDLLYIVSIQLGHFNICDSYNICKAPNRIPDSHWIIEIIIIQIIDFTNGQYIFPVPNYQRFSCS